VAQINVTKIDPCPVDYNDFYDVMDRWLTDLVDVVNAGLTQLQHAITPVLLNITTGAGVTRTVTLAGLTVNSIVIPYLVSSTNPVTIVSTATGVNQFIITFSGDPGASAVISYLAYFAN